MRVFIALILVSLSISLAAQCTDDTSGSLTVTPALPGGGGTYPAGTVVQMCFELTEFNTPQANWFHAIIPVLGPGFDLTTLAPVSVPTSCAGTGTWGWYNTWTSCQLGITYGPGFAFDGSQGLGCGGVAGDMDPGNNWGDGGTLCANRIFCWEVTTLAPPAGACNAEFYRSEVYVYGDGEAGSWTNSPCLNDPPLCWPEIDDIFAAVDNPCPGNPFTLTGSFNSETNCGIGIVWTGPGGFMSTDLITTATMEGVYTLSVGLNGCNDAMATVNAQWVGTNPTLTPSPTASFCFGETVTLTAGGGTTYEFRDQNGNIVQPEGPNNTYTFTATDLTAGVYTVTVFNAPNCQDDLITEIIVAPELMPMAVVNPMEICEGESVTLTGSGAGPGGSYEWTINGGQSSANPYVYTPNNSGLQTATLTVTNTAGCMETTTVDFLVHPLPNITVNALPDMSCEGEPVELFAAGGDTYVWTNDQDATVLMGTPVTVFPGVTTTYTVSVTDANGCSDTEDVTVEVQPLLQMPDLDCSSTNPSNITFSWPAVNGADFYEIYIDGVLVEAMWTGTSYTLTGLDPVTTRTIRVIPFSNNNVNCPGLEAELTCTSPDCNPLDIIFDPIEPFCFDPNDFTQFVQLIAGASGTDASNGEITWSGPGVLTTTNPGQLFPPAAGTYTVTATFVLFDGSCEVSETIDIVVVEAASATIDASATEVCGDGQVTVQLDGTFNPSATYDWSFGGATIESGSNEGPYVLSFPNAGQYTIGLETTLGDCMDMDEVVITVADSIPAPVVFCQRTTQDSVVFAWADVPGATSYTVTVVSGPMGTRIGNTYAVGGLNFGDIVEITVTAEGDGICPSVTSAVQACQAQSCPDVVVAITTPTQSFCNDGDNPPITLDLTVTDAVAPTDTVWAGPGVVGNTFDADIAGVGTHTVTVTVTDENCPFTTSVDFVVNELPDPVIVAPDTVCLGDTDTIRCDVMAGLAPYTYAWSTGQSTQEIVGVFSGEISVTVTDANMCTAADTFFIEEVTPLADPIIDCINPGLDEVTFEWTLDPRATGVSVTVVAGPTGTQTGNTYRVTGLSEGDQVTIEVVALGADPCGDSAPVQATCDARSCDAITLEIDETTNSFCPDPNGFAVLTVGMNTGMGTGTTTWSGPGVSNDTFYYGIAGVGAHEIILSYVEDGCAYGDTATFTVFPLPSAEFLVIPNRTLCTDEVVVVTYIGGSGAGSTFDWDFDGGNATPGTGEGPHTVSWSTPGQHVVSLVVTENGCPSETFTDTLDVVAPLAVPNVICAGADLNNVSVSWDPVLPNTGYEVRVNGGMPDTVFVTNYQVGGLTPDSTVTISVIALSDGPCGNSVAGSADCTSEACPPIGLDFSANTMAFCLDTTFNQSFTLQAIATGGSGTNPAFVWSGPGVTGDVFNPATAGLGTHTIILNYSEAGPCTAIDSFTITVNAIPTPDFTIDLMEACVGQTVTVTYTGSADPDNDTFLWDFAGATIVSGSGAGPYELTWPNAGLRQVTLMVTTVAGCTNTSPATDIDIIAPLATPVVTCSDQQLEQVTFSWPAVPGALGYEVAFVDGTRDTVVVTSYTVMSLTPATSVGITVTALGGPPCGNSQAGFAFCSSLPCPTITLNPSAPAQGFCQDGVSSAVLLSATSSGGDMTGTFTWTGNGVTMTGPDFFFDPNLAGIGEHVLYVDYVETAGCSARDSLTMNVFTIPTASFTISADSICRTDIVTVAYNGTASMMANFDWNFSDATVVALGSEVYELSWSTPGLRTISLTVTEAGCSSMQDTTIFVQEPLVMPAPVCSNSDLTSVTFSWPVVVGATGYLVSIDNGTPFTQDSTTFTATGLTDDQTVTLTVVALGPDPCGNSEMATISCTSDPCPDVSLTPSAPQTSFCTDAGDAPVMLSLLATGGAGGGTITWTGTGVNQVGNDFFFDPTGLAANTYVLTASYQESICPYTTSITMTVNATPVAAINSTAAAICQSGAATFSFNGSAGAGANYQWDFDGANVTAQGNESYFLGWDEAGDYTISLTVTENGCTTTAERNISVEAVRTAGQQAQERTVCAGAGEIIDLSELLAGADPGGTWSAAPGSPAVVDAGTGVMSTNNVPAGTYGFIYTIEGQVCDDVSALVNVTVQPAPVAEAGFAETITCDMGMVSLNGSASTGGSALTYEWTGPDGVMIIGATNPLIDVSQPGVYTLTVTSDIGCSDTDQVEVLAETEVPVPQIELSNISCFSADDGAILITETLGGRPPYNYSLNGATPSNSTFFTGLEQGEYSIRVTDANGCYSDLFIDITEPDQLRVSISLLNEQTEYNVGDQVTLTAQVSGGNIIDTVVWEPDTLGRIGEGNSITFAADETRQIRVTVTDEQGCSATDITTIIVRRDDPVYIPTGFSPNGDNINDILFVAGNGEEIEIVQDFLVFNRWGESVFENYDFQPNDPAQGWDGFHRGEPLNPAVFVYTATVRLTNGEVRQYKGDITLIR